MKKFVKLFIYLTIVLLAISGGFYAGRNEQQLVASLGTIGVKAQPQIPKSSDADSFALLWETINLLRRSYYKDFDISKEIVYGAIRGALHTLDDGYTRFMEPQAYQRMAEETKGEFGGVGIQIGIKNDNITVIAPIEDTPAARADIKAEDIIVKIDEKSTEGMALDEAVSLIRGKPGTKVTLTIWRKGFSPTGKPFEIIRDIIKLKAIKTYKMLDNKIAYIRLTNFSEEAIGELRNRLIDFRKQDTKALIFDLRGNPGGLLDSAIEVSNLFMKEGPIVHVVEKGERRMTHYAKSYKKVIDVPMVILVNRSSASASEIVSGAMQDNNIATLIGETTFGKGLVQTVHTLADGSAVAITTAQYLTSKDHDINKKGIKPDIEVKIEMSENSTESEESDEEEKTVSKTHGFATDTIKKKEEKKKEKIKQDKEKTEKTKTKENDVDLEKDLQLKKAYEFLNEKLHTKKRTDKG